MPSKTLVIAPDQPAAPLPTEPPVVRRRDGSIDEDHYIKLARELRAEHLRTILGAVPKAAQAVARRLARALRHYAITGSDHRGSAVEKP